MLNCNCHTEKQEDREVNKTGRAYFVAFPRIIEDNGELCSIGSVWRCLLVQQKGKKDGVLVIPVDQCFVKYAAYYDKD